MTAPSRPDRLVVITGTGTEVGKTWWAAALARDLRARGVRVAARKPVQSFAADDPRDQLDAAILAAATGEDTDVVCPPHRHLPVPMAPPIAAAHLGFAPFTIDELIDELTWPAGTGVGLVEGAGGLRSPLADDGDTQRLIEVLQPDAVVVVAPAALGVIHHVRLVVDALWQHPVTIALNQLDEHDPAQRASRDWLVARDGLDVVTSTGELAARWA